MGAALLGGFARPFSGIAEAVAEFQVHPHYKIAGPLDALFLKIDAKQDAFQNEANQEQVAARLVEWSGELQKSPGSTHGLEQLLAPGFRGVSPSAVQNPPILFGDGK